MNRTLASSAATALLLLGTLACDHAAGAPRSAAKAKPPAAASTPTPTPVPVAQSQEEIPRVTPKDAKAAVDAGTAVIVDVRDNSSWEMAHVKGALHIPLADLESRMITLPRDKRIIAYCS